MGRRASREITMKLLYQLEFHKDGRNEQINDVLEENETQEEDRQYILDVIDGINDNLAFIDDIIDKFTKGWKLNRISRIDLSILRISIYEIYYRKDIPISVSVNEAVELAKKYSSEEAGSFVNGILGKITKTKVNCE